jgi:hypothetical protein
MEGVVSVEFLAVKMEGWFAPLASIDALDGRFITKITLVLCEKGIPCHGS